MTSPGDLRYSPAHTWVRIDGDDAIIGITDFAQEQMGDLLVVQLPRAGETIAQDEPFGTVQSFKTTEDLIAPVDGEVVATNADARRSPKTVNRSPEDRGWLVRVRLTDPRQLNELLDGPAYRVLVTANS